MEDPSLFLGQWQMNTLDEFNILPFAFGENLQNPFIHPIGSDKPAKQHKSNSWNSGRSDDIPSPQAAFSSNANISFVNSQHTNLMSIMQPKVEPRCSKSPDTYPSEAKRTGAGTRLSYPQDHIIAERKRREKLSQRFIALSAIVPGLKKTDKASVLGDTIKYVKQLQEKLNILEEETRKKTMESVVYVKKTQIFAEGENVNGPFDLPLPEIEARFSEKNVLLRIHCEKRTGVLEKILAEIQKFQLTIVNTSVMTFGSSALDITIIAQMDVEFCVTMNDLVKNLRSVFISFM